jgi:hypothetical protein
LGAVGNLAATGLTKGSKALLNHIMSKNARGRTEGIKHSSNTPQLDEKFLAVLQNIIGVPAIPISNINGSGTRGRTGAGIKKF